MLCAGDATGGSIIHAYNWIPANSSILPDNYNYYLYDIQYYAEDPQKDSLLLNNLPVTLFIENRTWLTSEFYMTLPGETRFSIPMHNYTATSSSTGIRNIKKPISFGRPTIANASYSNLRILYNSNIGAGSNYMSNLQFYCVRL